jgi:hypothetical protein
VAAGAVPGNVAAIVVRQQLAEGGEVDHRRMSMAVMDAAVTVSAVVIVVVVVLIVVIVVIIIVVVVVVVLVVVLGRAGRQDGAGLAGDGELADAERLGLGLLRGDGREEGGEEEEDGGQRRDVGSRCRHI